MKLKLLLVCLLLQSCESMPMFPNISTSYFPNTSRPNFADISTPDSLNKRIEHFFYSLSKNQLIRIYFNNSFEECLINVEKNYNGYTWLFFHIQTSEHPVTTTKLKEVEELHYPKGSRNYFDAKKITRQIPITETTIQKSYIKIPILKFEIINNNLYFSTNKNYGPIYESINRNKDFFIELSNSFITQRYWINTAQSSFFTWNNKSLIIEPNSIKINLENNNNMVITLE